LEQGHELTASFHGHWRSLESFIGIEVPAMSDGPEPLLLLPGTLCDARVWKPVVAELPQQPVIVGSMLGAETTPDLAQQLLAQAPARFALAGHSLGGIVALEMAAQQPGRITRLALLDTNARPDPPPNLQARRAAVAQAETLGLERHVREQLWPLYVSSHHQDDERMTALIVDMAVSLGLEAFRTQSEAAHHRADSRPRLRSIRVPTLVLCGEDDLLCPVDAHREMADGILGAQLTIVPRSGHFALIEQPTIVADHLRAWLRRSNDTSATCPEKAEGLEAP
jgi:pimeloyl-ACP methyl ester carboxylesterase